MSHFKLPKYMKHPIIVVGVLGGILTMVGIGAGAAALHISAPATPITSVTTRAVTAPQKTTTTSPVAKSSSSTAQATPAPLAHHAVTASAPAAAATVAAAAPAPTSTVSSLQPSTDTAGAPATAPAPTSTTSATPSSNVPPASNVAVHYSSTNWAGYAALNGSYTSVAGSWTVPTPSSGSSRGDSLDAAWVGIGGVSSNDLIQTGTDDDVASDGTVAVSAFYELLPANAQFISTLTINPGDAISASVVQTASNTWTISISDVTDGQSFSTSVSYTSSLSSAEWIEEDPSYSDTTLAPLDNFGTVQFSGCSANNQMADTFTPASITLVGAHHDVRATPSALTSGVFSVTHS